MKDSLGRSVVNIETKDFLMNRPVNVDERKPKSTWTWTKALNQTILIKQRIYH